MGRGRLGGVHPQALWRVCRDGVAAVPPPAPTPPSPDPPPRPAAARRPGPTPTCRSTTCSSASPPRSSTRGSATGRSRDGTTGSTGRSSHCTAGRAVRRSRGGAGWRPSWTGWQDGGVGPLESARESLDLLGVPEAEWDAYLSATLLALRGWAGITRFLEERAGPGGPPGPGGEPGRVPGGPADPGPAGAGPRRPRVARVRRPARAACGTSSASGSARRRPPSVEQRAFPVFQLAQVLGWTPEELSRLAAADWARLVGEIEAFSAVERRRVFHLAYERRFYTRTLDAIALHAADPVPEPAAAAVPGDLLHRRARGVDPPAPRGGGPRRDDVRHRRVLLRGHVLPRGGRRPLHPALPGRDAARALGRRRRSTTDWRTRTGGGPGRGGRSGSAAHRVHVGSRTFAAGAVLSAALGVLASVPLVARTLFPRLTAPVREAFGRRSSGPAADPRCNWSGPTRPPARRTATSGTRSTR